MLLLLTLFSMMEACCDLSIPSTFRNFNALIRELLAGWVLLPLADVLADPSILNSLLLLLLGHQQLTQYKDDNDPKVKFLEKFVGIPSKTSSVRVLPS